MHIRLPEGLEDVSTYPYLFSELIKRGWTDDELMKLAGMNLVRVFKDAEKVICDDHHVVLFCVKFIDAFNTFYTGFDVGLRKKDQMSH